ncbi:MULTISPECIES: glycosyltransferase family 4 protein [unclassified Blastococcus]|uniref:glycosyltransferase family 4 protein n=1 Tax=unclassified Blastococcus TaxID=2619396 RepID=UPI001EEFACCC|nr:MULTISPECIES: glycosyltransferase family 4 protein [unclassified Blastococcus]
MSRPSRPVLRVTQIGNASQGRGGVSSVVRTTNSWSGPDLEVREWPSYWHGDRRRTLTAFARTALSVLTSKVEPTDVWHFHLTQHGSFLREGLLLALARRRGVCCTVLVHGSQFVAFAEGNRWLARLVLRLPAVVFVLTEPAAEVLRSLGIDAVRVANSVPIEEDPVGAGRSGFVFAGEIGPRKGADVLLDAWSAARLDGEQLVLFGDLAPQFRLPDPLPSGVVFEGPVSPEQVRARLRTAVALVLPSRAEAMPMIILESMSLATPVIASDVGQIAEVVDDTGMVVPPADADALGTAIRRMAGSPELAQGLGRRAWDRVRARHSNAVVRKVFVEHWRKCVEEARTGDAARRDPPDNT